MVLKRRPQLKRRSFVDEDLAGSDWSGLLVERCEFDRCDLSQVRWRGGNDQRNAFRGCDFRGAEMRLGLLGVGTVYTECTFTATDFRQAGFAYPRFDQCVFDDCDLEGVDFNASAFVNCSFVGRVESVFFRGGFWSEYDLKRYGTQVNPMRNVDFSRAVLEDVAFANGCDLATVIPPTNGSHMLFDHWQARLSRLRSEARGWPEADREQAALCAQVYGDVGQEWYLVNKADLVHVHGEAAGLRIASNLEQDLDRPVGVPPAKRV